MYVAIYVLYVHIWFSVIYFKFLKKYAVYIFLQLAFFSNIMTQSSPSVITEDCLTLFTSCPVLRFISFLLVVDIEVAPKLWPSQSTLQ